MTTLKNLLLLVGLIAFTTTSCNKDDDDPQPSNQANFNVTIENIQSAKDYMASGSIGFIMPGQSESYSFHAGKGSYFSFATMFVQSNDLFYGFGEKGLALYDENSGNAITGDVTAMIELWDAGTEVNEEPGVGPNQAPRQSGPNTGTDENGTVEIVNDGFTYPTTNTVIRVMLAHDGGTEFTVTIDNISDGATLGTPFAPGAWAVHNGDIQLFTAGQTAPDGLEGVAEDGDNASLVQNLEAGSGYFSPLAPGVYVVHGSTETPLFENGQADRGEGLEALAEDGDPSGLDASLAAVSNLKSSNVFNTPEGASGPGPLLPGQAYSFSFEAEEGDYLNLATMLVHTNDLFFAFGENGISLFNNGTAVSGDVTSEILLWDAGTEVNEYPGAGNNQPARGGGNSGDAENGNVQPVNDGFTYPAVNELIRVTVSPQ